MNIRIIGVDSSRNRDLGFAIYSDKRTVFAFVDVAMLVGETDRIPLVKKLDYHIKTGKLLRPRKEIYAKKRYNPEELVCSLYTPSYISLEYVLQRAGVVFQYDEAVTAISYLSRGVEVDGRNYSYRKVKGEVIAASDGIQRRGNINIATPERAFLDLLYLAPNYFFDKINLLNKKLIMKLLPIYGSKVLDSRVAKILKNG